MSSLHVSSHAFRGPAQKASQMCFHQGKKITVSLPKHLSHSLSFPGSLPLALTLRQLMWGWGTPHLRTGQSHLSSFTLPRGPAVGAMGRMCQAITRQSTPQQGDGSQTVGRMWPEAGSDKNASSTPCRSEDLLPAAQTSTWRL